MTNNGAVRHQSHSRSLKDNYGIAPLAVPLFVGGRHRKIKQKGRLVKLTSLKNKVKGAVSYSNRRCFSANGFSLLPLALRPRLFLSFVAIVVFIAFGIWFDNDTFATNSTISLNVTQNIASLDIRPIDNNGTFSNSGTDVAFTVTTNNFSGYSLSIAASNDNIDAANLTQTVVKNEGTENEQSTIYRIESLGEVEGMASSGITEAAFSNTSNTQYNNKWGIKPNKLNSADNTNYLPIPTSTSDSTTLDTTSVSGTNNYTINIGARVDATIPTGAYNNVLVITAVANLINYEITYDKGNTEDTVTSLPASQTGVIDDPTTNSTNITLSSTRPSRTGYIFNGWCTELPTIGTNGNSDTCSGTTYATSSTYNLDATISPNVTLYAMWQEVYSITFTAGNNINTIMVADSSESWKPYYITTGNSKTFSKVPKDRKYIVTVIPEANYKLDSWTSSNNTTERLVSDTLLTTNYISGATSEALTANGVSGTYTIMKDFALSSCTVAGNNVTDERDGKSYTVAKFGNYCFMLSNLRLDGGTTLNKDTSDVTANTFTLPDQYTWTSSAQDHICEARMRYYDDEYYYNWAAITANPTVGLTSTNNCADDTFDNASLGSICPKNWTLLNVNNILTVGNLLWDNGNNSGMMTTTGYIRSGSRRDFGVNAYYRSKSRYGNYYAYFLFLGGTTGIQRNFGNKFFGFSARCVRGS